MDIGVVFPQYEIGNDPIAIRDFAQAAEGLGYSHLLLFDHVLGAVKEHREPPLTGPYDERSTFREAFVLFGYLAGLTSRIGFATGVLVLPQRQAALVAKQAAEVDVLSGGRLRLGVGTGWNYVEYESLNETFHDRGLRQEEQVEVIRQLWRREVVDFTGNWHRIDRAAIAPRPARDIPIWFGGSSAVVYRRAARLGDGFIVAGRYDHTQALTIVDRVRAALQDAGRNPAGLDDAGRNPAGLDDAGRNPAAFGIDVVTAFGSGPQRWEVEASELMAAGTTQLTLRTMEAGLDSVQDHIDALRNYRDSMSQAGPDWFG